MAITKDSENLYSSMRFVGDGVTKRVPLTFDLREGDGLAVDFGEGLVTSGYLIDYDVTPVVVLFSEPLPLGKTITIRRLTKIDEVKHIFQWTGNAQGGADFSAKNVDENFEQITRASQDAMDSQTLASETLEEMAGIRDDALDARDKAKVSEDNAKASETNAKASETNASKSASEAKDSENLAYKWANNPEDTPVRDEEYSAYHWSKKAESSAGGLTPSVVEELNKKADLTYVDDSLETKLDKASVVNEWGGSPDKTLSQGFLTTANNAIFDRLVCVTPEQFGAVGDGVADDTSAIQSAIDTGLKVILSKIYKVTQELEIKTVGQTIEFANSIYGYGDSSLNLASGNCYLKPVGSNFRKAVRTYRNWRGSASDPSDAPFSVVINVQAEGTKLINPTIKLEATENVDVGIFCGSRVGVAIFNPVILGYFRKASMYYDVSQAHGLRRHLALDGTRYEQGSVRSGADGCSLHNPTLIGGNIGLAVLGAKFEDGKSDYDKYYDDAQGLITDGRGSFGFSDFTVFGGRIYSTDKEDRTRTADPTVDSNGNLSQALMEQESDFSPASMYVDGICANASKSLWGMRFFSTRFATYEMFRVRLGRCSRISFYSCHIEGRGSESNKDTNGNNINSNDYEYSSYGDICGTQNTGNILVVDTVRNTPQDCIPHYYGSSYYIQTSTARVFTSSNAYQSSAGEMDIRGDDGVRLRKGSTSLALFRDSGAMFYTPISSNGTNFLDLRGGGGVRLRHGDESILTATNNIITTLKPVVLLGGGRLYSGDGAPTTPHPLGSVYIDVVNGDLYIRKPNNTWVKIG